MKTLRIFAASPSDVAAERAKVEIVVAALEPLAKYIGVALEVIDWRKLIVATWATSPLTAGNGRRRAGGMSRNCRWRRRSGGRS